MVNPSIERLLMLVCRELGAESARVLDATSEEPHADNVLVGKLPDGRGLAVVFASPPPAKDALARRLQMLASTFSHSLEEGGTRRSSRPAPARSLQEELRALSVRARATDAAVIDAHSPVVWGRASAEKEESDAIPFEKVSSSRLPDVEDTQDALLQQDIDGPDSNPPHVTPVERVRELTERAVDAVRDLPAVPGLRKGGHLAHTFRDPGFGFVARSFASIYVLIVVFDDRFDELRAEQAIEDGLPRIERLVLALPPLDPKPAPIAGAIAMRGHARRR